MLLGFRGVNTSVKGSFNDALVMVSDTKIEEFGKQKQFSILTGMYYGGYSEEENKVYFYEKVYRTNILGKFIMLEKNDSESIVYGYKPEAGTKLKSITNEKYDIRTLSFDKEKGVLKIELKSR